MKKANAIEFSDAILGRIAQTIQEEPQISRCQLSRRVCEWLDLRNPRSGKLQEMSCRKALLELDRQGVIELPASRQPRQFKANRLVAPPAITPLNCILRELGHIELKRVSRGDLSDAWRGMMDAYHYLKSGPLCGEQIKYLIKSEHCGWVGGLSFSAAALSVDSRDQWIGWSPQGRRANRHLLVNNSRFLIPPMVQVKDLASHVLSVVCEKLPDDWEERYGYRPVMLETFVESERYAGSSYAGAGWQYVGKTKGRGRKEGRVSIKDIYLKPLTPEWRKQMCALEGKVQVIVPTPPQVDAPRDWVEEEFGRVQLPDRRLAERLLKLTGLFYEHPSASILQACGSVPQAMAAYRFLDNERVDWQSILESHYQATEERMREHEWVLVAQDTTTLNFSNLKKASGFGPICDKKNVRGLIVHDTLAFTEQGTPLGLLDVQCWSRGAIGKSKERKNLPIEEKESYKWLTSFHRVSKVQNRCRSTRIVLMADREADIYEFFTEHQKTSHPADLLIRADRCAQRRAQAEPEEEIAPLWEILQNQTEAIQKPFLVPPAQDRPARQTILEVRFAQVTLQPPKKKPHLPPIVLWAVYAREKDSSEIPEPDRIDWMLLTTVKTTTGEQALARTQWYAKRWGIEVFHRIFKSGCNVEKRQLAQARRLLNCLAIDLVIAWRIYFLTIQGRKAPDISCSVYFSEEEWKALFSFMDQNPHPPAHPPSFREAVVQLARLGGYLGRKHDDPPGNEVIWRGLTRLADVSRAYKLYATES